MTVQNRFARRPAWPRHLRPAKIFIQRRRDLTLGVGKQSENRRKLHPRRPRSVSIGPGSRRDMSFHVGTTCPSPNGLSFTSAIIPAPMERPLAMRIILCVRINRRFGILPQHPGRKPGLQRVIRHRVRRIRSDRFRRQMRQIDAHDVLRMLCLKRVVLPDSSSTSYGGAIRLDKSNPAFREYRTPANGLI